MARKPTRHEGSASDSGRINVRTDSQLHYWMKIFDVDQKSLTQAVKVVGPSADKVREYLQSKAPPS